MAIAVDFDGVIHAYSKGWHDGTIYDPPLPGALEGLRALMAQHAVFVFTTRDRHQVATWLSGHGFDAIANSPVSARVFWNERGRLLVSNQKLAATAYLDDRAVRFENWDQALAVLGAGLPLNPYYSHEACGFHWHGHDGLDLPMRDGQPVCPRCELERAQATIARVRELGPDLELEATLPGMHDAAREAKRDASRRLRAIIDQPKEQ